MYTEVSTLPSITADAHFVSPLYGQAGTQCTFKFWYHMWGPSIGTLNVFYRRNSKDLLQWTRTRNQGNQWNQGVVTLPKCANDFKVSGHCDFLVFFRGNATLVTQSVINTRFILSIHTFNSNI